MAPKSGTREALRRRYLEVDTATVADVLDALGLPDQGLAPHQLNGHGPAPRRGVR